MISQLFALPLRALIVVTALPTPPALGAALAGPSTTFGAAMSSPPAEREGFVPQAPIPTPSISRPADPAGGGDTRPLASLRSTR